MDKKTIWIFILLIVGVIMGLILTVILTLSSGTKDEMPIDASREAKQSTMVPEKEKEEVSSQKGTTKEGKSNKSLTNTNKKEEEKTKADDIFKRPVKDKELIEENNIVAYETKAREHFEKFEFLEGAEYLYEQTKMYDLNGEGQVLQTLLEDASILANIGESSSEEGDGEGHIINSDGIYYVLSSVRDPEMALLGMLSLGYEQRNQMLQSLDSLNPIFDGHVEILSKSIVSKGRELEVLKVSHDVKTLHRIEFRIQNETLYADVIENSEGYSYVNGIFEVEEGSSHYLTVDEWKPLMEKMK